MDVGNSGEKRWRPVGFWQWLQHRLEADNGSTSDGIRLTVPSMAGLSH